MAVGAALLHDRPDLREGHRRARRGRGRGPDPDRDTGDRQSCRDRNPPERAARVAVVEVHAHECADRHQADEDRPAVRVPVRERKVAREHREEHGEREVVVVHRALFAAPVRRRVRIAPSLLRADQLPMRRDDDEEDVRRHDRPEHRPDLEVRGARGEEMRHAVRSPDEEADDARGESELAASADGATQRVVHEPRRDQQTNARADRLQRRKACDRRVDQRRVRLEVVEDDEEREAREPRPVRLPLEPVQRLRQALRRDAVLLDPVEAAAVDLPRVAGEVVAALRRLEVVVERDEVERRPDPHDRGDDVEPAEDEVEPVRRVGAQDLRHRSSAIETSASSPVSSSCSRVFSSLSRSSGRISARERPFTKTTKRKP